MVISFDPSQLGTPDFTLNSTGATLQIFKPGAGLVYTPSNTDNKIVLVFESIVELSSTGSVVSGNSSLSNVNFVADSGDSVCPFQGLSCVDYQLSLTINGEPFVVEVLLFTEAGQINLGQNLGVYNVTAGTFKFNVNLANGYNFASSSNSLQVTISYRTVSDSLPSVGSLTFTGSLNGTKPSAVNITTDNILLVLPQFAVANGVDVPVTVTIDAQKIASTITVNVPYFTGSLVYDPVATSSSSTSSASSLFAIGVFSLISLLSFIVLF